MSYISESLRYRTFFDSCDVSLKKLEKTSDDFSKKFKYFFSNMKI